jgi:hypothetical protein
VDLIRDKLANSCDTLATLPPSPVIDAAIEKLETMLDELRSALPESIDELRLVEAQAAYAYFAAWQMLPLRWKGTGRKPIPPEWRHVVARPSMVSGRNQPRHTPGERDARSARPPVQYWARLRGSLLEFWKACFCALSLCFATVIPLARLLSTSEERV